MGNDSNQQCEKVKKLLPLYLSGEITKTEELEVEAHIKECSNCKALFEAGEDNLLLHGSEALKKSFKGLGARLMIKVGIIVIVFLLLIKAAFSLLPLISKGAFNEREEHWERAMTDQILLRVPLANDISVDSKIGILDTAINYKYSMTVIGTQYPPDGISYEIPHFFGKTRAVITPETDYNANIREFPVISYLLSNVPDRAANKIKNMWKSQSAEYWNKLENYPAETISQVIIHFNQPVTVNDMAGIIDRIGNVKLGGSWFSIDTGKAGLLAGPDPWGFSTMILKRGNSSYNFLGKNYRFYGQQLDLFSEGNTDKTAAETFKSAANTFADEMKKYQEEVKFLKDIHYGDYSVNDVYKIKNLDNDLKSINKNISENGIKFIGAAITAPTKNILKLKSDNYVRYIRLIGVDFDSSIETAGK